MNCVAYIGLGSNLAEPIQQVLQGIEDIKNLEHATINHISSLYQTPPMGPQDQPHYVNAVVEISTSLKPLPLLACLQAIETQRGRTRDTGRWGARTLDLDILLYEDTVSTDPILTLPHPGIALRSFVLYPLNEINPQLHIDGLGSISRMLRSLNQPCPSLINTKNLDIHSPV